jgi:membrane-bound metal-dependent hydrolase YbcI (DUF457 family)
MGPVTHNVTAGALAFSGAVFLCANPALAEGIVLSEWMPRSIPFAVGALLGARAPDWIELAQFSSFLDRRVSIIPHRTITHWPWLWLAALLIATGLTQVYDDYPGREVAWGCVGFILSGMLHLLLDSLTPTGIPLGFNPFGKRTAFAYMRNGSYSEFLVSLSAWAVALASADVFKRWT